MSELHRFDTRWEDVRGESGTSHRRFYEDADVLIATDFEGGNGHDIRRLGVRHYALRLEPEPGGHRFAGIGYYVCFGVRNLRREPQTVRVRLETRVHSHERWHDSRHLIVRCGDRWQQLDQQRIRPVGAALEARIDLPPVRAAAASAPLFCSNFHWWPYSERGAWLAGLPAHDGWQAARGRTAIIGHSAQGRAITAVELGRDDAPVLLMSQTTQASEALGSHACRALIEFLLAGGPEARAILESFRVAVIPTANPDGTVYGYGVTDGVGRFPHFEADLAADGDPRATTEMAALWRYVAACRPLLFWEWHSNNWHRRPGHVLIRYRHRLCGEPRRERLWDAIEQRLLLRSDTYHEIWTSPGPLTRQSRLSGGDAAGLDRRHRQAARTVPAAPRSRSRGRVLPGRCRHIARRHCG